MPVEVGVGYVSVVPETRGFGRLLTQQISGESARAGSTAGEEAGDGFLGGLGGKVKAGAAGVALAGGALFAAGFAEAVEQDKATAKLGASLGLSEKATARAGKVAGSIYAQGYGESIDDVDESLKSLQRNGVAALTAPRKQLAGLSKDALNLADVFDADVADSTKAVGKLMSTGLVKDAKQGFDLLTAGFQSGADQAGDLIDTVNEYSTQWRKAGLSGSTAIGLINQGLKAGARDGDLVADSIKEFSIRAIDGSTSTASGFKALGLSADDMAGKFAKGGKSANGVLQLTLDRLRGIKDPVKQAQIATSLFGTQAEDLGKALFALDPSKAADGLGKVGGAAGRMGKTLSNTASHDIEVFKRQALQGLASFAAKYALPALRKIGGFLTTYVLPPAKQVGGVLMTQLVPAVKSTASALAAGAGWVQTYGAWLIPLAVAVGGVTLAMNASAIATGLAMGVMGAYSLLVRGVVAITRVWTATQAVFNGVMALNPITLIVIGVLALAAAAVVAFKKVGWFHDAVMTAWSGIKAGWDVLWNGALKPGFEYLKIGLQAIGSAAMWLWSTVLQPTFSVIATAGKVLFAVLAVVVIAPLILWFKALGAIAGWLWNNAIGPAFRGIVALAGWWWSGVKLYFGLVKAGFSAVGAVGMWLYRNAISPAFHGIVTLASWWWSGVKLYFGLVKTGLTAVGSVGMWLYRNAISPAFHGIASVASWLWSKGLKPVFDSGKTAVGLFAGAFDTAQKGIGRAFGKIKDATRKPVAFVVNTVYTNGIKKVWDGVAGFVGLDKLPAAKFAGGGRTSGGTPGKDSIPILAMADEFIVKRDSARRIGFGALDYMNRTGELPVQRFADGGIVGDALSWVGGKAKAIGGAVMDGVDFLSSPGKLWDKAIAPVRNKIAQVGQSKYAQMIGKVPLKMLSSLKDKVVDAATSAFGGGSGDVGGSGVKRWTSVVLQALKMVGQPASLLATVLRRMNQESGGNPRAINNWDSNAKAGDPSRGLMQTIGSTFNAYAGNLRSRGIYDPLANVYASMRYALSRYGSLASAYNRPGGYASGGTPRAGEIAWVGERGPELVQFGAGGATVWDHRTSLGMAAGYGARGFAKGSAGARKEVPGDLKSFTKSLTGSASTIAKASKNLAADLKSAGGAGKSLAASVSKTSSTLQQLAKERDAIGSKLTAAKAAASDQKKNAADYLGLGNIDAPTSVGDLIAGMQSRQSTLKAFEQQIGTASKKGVSQSLIAQLVADGPDGNLARLVSGANAAQIKQLNSLAKSGSTLSTSYGRFMADAMYDSGVNAGKGFLTGLQSQEKALQKQMSKLGGVLVDAIEKRLDIHSPSRETERVGELVGAGVVVGSDRALADVRAGAARLGAAAIPPVVPVSAGQPAQAAGLRKGDTLVLRVGEREFVAVVDERVDAGLSDVRARGRAGKKR